MGSFIGIKVPPSLQFLKPFDGGHYIRLGRKGDGGYVLPSFIVGITHRLLSLGLSYEWSFDRHFQKLRPNLKIHGYDYTVSARKLIKVLIDLTKKLLKEPGKSNAGHLFHYLVILKDFVLFWTIRNRFFRQRVTFPMEHPYDISLDQAIDRILKDKADGLFVKMDIEGSEYCLVDCLLKYAGTITGLVIEFHEIDTNRNGFISAVKRLQQEFTIVHIHGNNMEEPDETGFLKVLETTWVRKDLLPSENTRNSIYLHGTDAPNGNHAPDYIIEF